MNECWFCGAELKRRQHVCSDFRCWIVYTHIVWGSNARWNPRQYFNSDTRRTGMVINLLKWIANQERRRRSGKPYSRLLTVYLTARSNRRRRQQWRSLPRPS